MKNNYIVGSRGSLLARTQTEIVINKLKTLYPETDFQIKIITTTGDKILDKSLDKIGGKGLFINEIEECLANKEIDFAVHSLKDMPNTLAKEFCIASITEREDPRDVLISRQNIEFKNLSKNSTIGTSSIRRTVQLQKMRQDLNYLPIRGNIDTRIQKMLSGEFDAIILAAAGLKRLGWVSKISEYFQVNELIPAAGQGALAIEARNGDFDTIDLLKNLNNEETRKCVFAERAFLKEINGGCHIPAGVYAKMNNSQIQMNGFLHTQNKFIYKDICGEAENFKNLGILLAQKIMGEV